MSGHLKVLLIEDSRGDAILLQKALDLALHETHSVQQAGTLSDALKILSHDKFDVALLDRSLPDAEGFDSLHSIQNMAPELPVIFVTAYKDEKMAFDAIGQGAQDYMFKDKVDAPLIQKAIQYAILRKQFESTLIARANYDMLTGLANRMLFESRVDMALHRMKRLGSRLAVLFLDLDGFKAVNDSLGHNAGDAVLREAARRLKNSLRSYDTVARFGGDEFAVLLENLPGAQYAELVAQKIIAEFAAPFVIAGRGQAIGVSIGITTLSFADYATRDELIRRADAAMYEAKSVTGSACRLFGASRSAEAAA